jgi:transposase
LAKIAELEKRLEQFEGPKTPQNSSLPPSSQHPHAARPKSKRKRGGQPRHRKYDRALIPTSDCDETKTLKPTACRRCGTRLSGSDPAPLRHQTKEGPARVWLWTAVAPKFAVFAICLSRAATAIGA